MARRVDYIGRYPTPDPGAREAIDESLRSHVRWFRQNNEIQDLGTLRRVYSTCGIVAVDTEPWAEDTSLVSEMAFTFLPPLSISGSTPPPPTDFASFFTSTYTISIRGRRAAIRGRRERLDHGPRRDTCPEDVEDTIIDILEMGLSDWYKGSTISEICPLILTGYGLNTELRVLKDEYPRALQYFIAWTDMQTQLRSVTTLIQKHPKHYLIGMHNALVLLGHGSDPRAVNTLQHRAGNDTARGLAIFLHLINRPPDALSLRFECPDKPAHKPAADEAQMCFTPEMEAWTGQEWQEELKQKKAAAKREADKIADQARRDKRREEKRIIRQEKTNFDEEDEDLFIPWCDDADEWAGTEPQSGGATRQQKDEMLLSKEADGSSEGRQNNAMEDIEYLLQCAKGLKDDTIWET